MDAFAKMMSWFCSQGFPALSEFAPQPWPAGSVVVWWLDDCKLSIYESAEHVQWIQLRHALNRWIFQIAVLWVTASSKFWIENSNDSTYSINEYLELDEALKGIVGVNRWIYQIAMLWMTTSSGAYVDRVCKALTPQQVMAEVPTLGTLVPLGMYSLLDSQFAVDDWLIHACIIFLVTSRNWPLIYAPDHSFMHHLSFLLAWWHVAHARASQT